MSESREYWELLPQGMGKVTGHVGAGAMDKEAAEQSDVNRLRSLNPNRSSFANEGVTMATRKSEIGPIPDSSTMLSEQDQSDLSRAFQALSNPLTRHLVELLAIEPLTHADLSRHFDLKGPEVGRAASVFIKAGLARQKGDCFHLDHRVLNLIRSWLDRIAQSRPGG